MATTITKVQKGKKKSTNAAEQHKEDLLWLKKHVGRDFTKWREFVRLLQSHVCQAVSLDLHGASHHGRNRQTPRYVEGKLGKPARK